jgi:hypothetical protein
MTSLLIGTALVLATAALARRLGGDALGLTAGVLAAVHPNLWQIDTILYPEALLALLVVAALVVAYAWRERPQRRLAAALGALIALGALTRGEAILYLPVLAVPWMLSSGEHPRRERLTHLGIAVAACLAVLAPWTIRNAIRFDEPVPLSTNGNELLVYANCDSAYRGVFAGYWDYQCQQRIREANGDPPGDESEQALAWRRIGVDYAKQHAGELPRVVTLRVLRQWDLFRPLQNVRLATIEGRDLDANAAGLLMYGGLAVAAVPGTIALRRRGIRVSPMLSTVIVITLTAAATYGSLRFRAPVEPVLCITGGAGILAAARWLRSYGARQRALAPDADPAAFVLGGRGGAGAKTSAALGVIAALIALPLRGLYATTGGNMEEGFMLVFPERMLRGAVPNRDFLHLYGPASLDVLALWYRVFGVSLAAERTFGLLQHVAIIAALFVLARPWGRVMATLVAALAVVYVLTPVGLTAMAWNGGLALALWSTVLAVRALHLPGGRPRVACAAAAGTLAGLALAYRPDLALATALVVGYAVRRGAPWRPVAMGAVVGLSPLWIHIARVGPTVAWRDMVLDPVVHLRAGRSLPRPPSWSHLDGALQAVAELVPPWWRVPALTASQALFLWFLAMLAAPLLLLAVAAVLRRDGAGTRATVMSAVALLAVGIVPQGWQRPDSTHLSWVTCVSFPFAVVALAELVRRRRPLRPPIGAALTGTAVVVALTLLVAPLYTFRYYLLHTRVGLGDVPRPFAVEHEGRRFYLGAYDAYLATEGVVRDLDRLAAPGERLLVGPSDLSRTYYSDAFIYYLFPELTPATRFVEMDPGLANAAGSGLAADVASADWVVLTRFWDGWVEPNDSLVAGSPEPMQVLADGFSVAGTYEDGLAVLYRRCDR